MTSNADPYGSTAIVRAVLEDPTSRDAGNRFGLKYQPRIFAIFKRRGLQDCDADDLTADLLADLLAGGGLRRVLFVNREKFNHWIEVVVHCRVMDFYRRRGRSPDAWSVGNPDAQEALNRTAAECARELADTCAPDRDLASLAMSNVKTGTAASQWRAWEAGWLEGRPAADVGRELGMTNVAVWKAQSRVNKCLKEEFLRLQARGLGGDE